MNLRRLQFGNGVMRRVVSLGVLVVGQMLSTAPHQVAAATFSPGNLVVLRIGDGTATLSSAATAVFLDEFTTSGAAVQTFSMPTTVNGNNRILTNSGSATSEGALARSADGRYLTLAGYDAAPGTASVVSTASATVNRIVARVDADGNIDTSTRITDAYTGNNIRGAVSNDGAGFWTAGTASGTAGGVHYVPFGNNGATTQLSSAPTNVRVPNIYGGQLFVSSGSGSNIGVNQVGTGLPVASGQTTTLLPGLPGSGNPYAYVLLDRDPGVPGLDTLYVADQTSANGLLKYSFDGTTWTARGNIAGVLTGLTGYISGDSVMLYATVGNSAGNNLVSFTDSAAFDANISAGTFTVLATAGSNTVFRGVAFAPESGSSTPVPPSIVTGPTSQTIYTGATATLNVSASGSSPLNYQWYQGASGDTGLPVGTNAPSFTTPALITNTSYWVRVSNAAGSADSATATITVSEPPPVCGGSFTQIGQVEGITDVSPFSGAVVTVQGVVVGDYEGPSPALRGFYLQDEPGTADGDPATSDGIFVFEANNANIVSNGQVVRVTGRVAEYQGQTEIDNISDIQNCGRTASVTPVDVTMPFPAPVDGVPYLERFEGMLVRFPQTLYVTEHYQLERFGQVVMSSGDRLEQPTNVITPGAPAQALQAANDLNSIIFDDELNNQDPDPIEFGRGGIGLSVTNTLRGGDTVSNAVGVLNYTWAGNSASGNAYRLRPINALGGGAPNFQPTNPRPASPPSVGGTFKVAGANLLNFFNTFGTGNCTNGVGGEATDCRGADSAAEFARQWPKTVAELTTLQADVIGVTEIENDGYGPDSAIQFLVDQLNAATAPGTFAFIDADAATGQVNALGTDAIKVGFIYKPGSVTPVSQTAVLNTGAFGLYDTGAGVIGRNRPALAQAFQQNATGERVVIVVNHLKSKGSSCDDNISPVGPDPDTGDGQGNCNQTRLAAAQQLTQWLATDPTGTGDPDTLIIGDLNSYAMEDPITAIKSAGYTNLIAKFIGQKAYSYVFDGQWGYLDHALASPSLTSQVTGVGDWHINADEPSALDYNTDYKSAGQLASLYAPDQFRVSDHDPVLVGLNLHTLPQANADVYTAEAGVTLNVTASQGILSNDAGGPLTIISHTDPTHGTLALNADGSFAYMPAAGYTGADNFDYTVSNAVELYKTDLPALGSFGGVTITAGAFGSAVYPVPGSSDEFYGLTDRGPNVDGPNGTKIEPIPSFTPAIGKFKLVNGQAILEQTIPLQAADGTPYSGRVNPQASTGETITDLDGNVLPTDPNGYDSEGLVALPDGTFWVSDEYGPFITHFDATGKQIGRLSPFDGTLPAELSQRVVNRGMEGLAITPDGSTLVGAMQSALQQSDLAGYDAKKLTALRIVTYKLATGETHEYVYLLDNPATTKTAVSEITALSNTTFLVDERDGNYPPSAYKKLFQIDISGATDVGPASTVSGASYDGAAGGLLIGGKTLELLVKGQDTNTSQATLASAGVTVVSKSLYLDVTALLQALDPQTRFFSHDKLEGVAVSGGGTQLVISNDSDFGIDGITNTTPPFQLHTKLSPTTGQQDDGEFLVIDLANLPAITSTASVTINTLDTIAPATSDDAPAQWQKADFNVSFTCTDAQGSGCQETQFRVDGGAWQMGNSVQVSTEGDHLIEYYSKDVAGNTETVKSTHAKLDKTAPTSSAAFGVIGDKATITLTASDNLSGIASTAYSVDGGATQTYNGPFVVTGMGAHAVNYFSTDVAGNVEAANTLNVDITNPCSQASVLDNFNRANGSLGNNWRGLTGTSFYKIAGNRLNVQLGGAVYWNKNTFGTSQVAFVTLSTVDTRSLAQGVLLKVQDGGAPDAGAISVVYDSMVHAVRVSAIRLGGKGWTLYGNHPATFANGDKLGACVKANGDVSVYKNDTLITTVTLNRFDKAYFNGRGGKIGLWTVTANQAYLDDFGGGTVTP
jgi:predicted extracellular nuclease